MSVAAAYHGTCSECLDPIIPGQQIESADDEWRHVDCGVMPERVECVCEKCMLVHVGECAW